MSKIRPKVRVKTKAEVGEVLKIKTLISHPMESGVRKNEKTGKLFPRDIIQAFSASFNGEIFFSAKMHPAISADPYFAFYFKVPGSGTFLFKWTDDSGTNWTIEKSLTAS